MGSYFSYEKIPLTKGYFALVDDCDYEWLNQWKWHARVKKNKPYAYRAEYVKETKKNKSYAMHRVIMGITDPEIFIDHKDLNGINNQRENLRICITRSHNVVNRETFKKYRGIGTWRSGRFFARVKYKEKTIELGTFDTEIEAAKAYNEGAIKYYGEFARLNKIE